MNTGNVRVVVAGVPRSFQRPLTDGRWLTPEHRDRIQAVSPRIELIHTCTQEIERRKGHFQSAEVLLVESCGRKRYGHELPYEDLRLLVSPSLRWVQSCSSGVGHILELDLIPETVPMTNASGVHARALGESVMAAVLLHAKRLVERLDNQRIRAWKELDCTELTKKTMCIIGTGSIGTHAARLASTCGMETIGIRRTPRPAEHFFEVYGRNRLEEVLGRSDYVVIACPLTAETQGMIGAMQLAAMKPGAYFINIARGKVVDEAALAQALERNHLSGAFLDAFAVEPLPPEHPLWTTPGVTITPHDSHSSPLIGDNIVALFCENLRRYLTGKPLANLVDRARGY